MASRIQFEGDPSADGLMFQWRGRNVSGETLGPASTHDYIIVFDGDNKLVIEERVTRQGELSPGDVYDSFTYVQLSDGLYSGYLTLDQDGDEDTIGDRQREIRFQVAEGRLIVL